MRAISVHLTTPAEHLLEGQKVMQNIPMTSSRGGEMNLVTAILSLPELSAKPLLDAQTNG